MPPDALIDVIHPLSKRRLKLFLYGPISNNEIHRPSPGADAGSGLADVTYSLTQSPPID